MQNEQSHRHTHAPRSTSSEPQEAKGWEGKMKVGLAETKQCSLREVQCPPQDIRAKLSSHDFLTSRCQFETGRSALETEVQLCYLTELDPKMLCWNRNRTV